MPVDLPSPPDFQALDLAALKTTDGRTRLFAAIGSLSCAWSNNESMFIYLIMLLLGTDEARAAIVYSTLNTTRARLDLVHRLSRIRVKDKDLRDQIDALIDGFAAANKLRNELIHATYATDERGNIAHTNSMRIVESKGKLSFGDAKPFDESRMQQIIDAVADLRDLNRQIWDLLPRLKAHVERSAGVGTG